MFECLSWFLGVIISRGDTVKIFVSIFSSQPENGTEMCERTENEKAT